MKPTLVFIHKRALLTDTGHRMQDLLRLIRGREDGGVSPKQTHSQKIFYFDDNTDLNQLIKSALISLLGEGMLTTVPQAIDGSSLPAISTQASDKVLHPTNTASALKTKAYDEEFTVSYHTHAFVGGTLKTVDFSVLMTLKQILVALDRIGIFTHQGLIRCLGELVDRERAHEIITERYPDVHAVSRCQILKSDAATIQDTLKSQGLICSAGAAGLWQLSDDGRLLVA